MSTGRSTLLVAATVLAVLGGGIAPAAACGLEDPSSVGVLRGTLNLAFPDSLHVGTAVWQAQLSGRLPRDLVAQRADLSPEARGQMRLIQATLAMRRLAAALAMDVPTEGRPVLAVVLVGPVLWTRIEPGAPAAEAQVHAAGPEPGDVVLVTESAAAEALSSGALGVDEALQLGLLRLYGPATDANAALHWLRGTLRGPRI
jgi:hypothetical protein